MSNIKFFNIDDRQKRILSAWIVSSFILALFFLTLTQTWFDIEIAKVGLTFISISLGFIITVVGFLSNSKYLGIIKNERNGLKETYFNVFISYLHYTIMYAISVIVFIFILLFIDNLRENIPLLYIPNTSCSINMVLWNVLGSLAFSLVIAFGYIMRIFLGEVINILEKTANNV